MIFDLQCANYIYLHLNLYKIAMYHHQGRRSLDRNKVDLFCMLVQLVVIRFLRIESHNLLPLYTYIGENKIKSN